MIKKIINYSKENYEKMQKYKNKNLKRSISLWVVTILSLILFNYIEDKSSITKILFFIYEFILIISALVTSIIYGLFLYIDYFIISKIEVVQNTNKYSKVIIHTSKEFLKNKNETIIK